MRRTILIVLDSVGAGELPDAEKYGDRGSNTLANTAHAVGGIHMPNLAALGLGNILPIEGVPPADSPRGAYGRAALASAGKDTTTGHWEIAGIILDKPFPTYPDGFPPEVIDPFVRTIGRRILGNKATSGTEIIAELGEQHLQTGYPIVYTSADSVFQIAAHEEVIPVEELYAMCETARALLKGDHAVGRVIARPFEGRPGAFQRTPRRRDFALKPPRPTLLDRLVAVGTPVYAVGKIEDIFAEQGITESNHTTNNMASVDATLRYMREKGGGLIFTNCVDFDMLYGHRNDAKGYARALEEFDARAPEIMAAMREEDLLIITADHGCDPTTPSTDHSREYVPLLVYGAAVGPGIDLGIRRSLADTGATVGEWLGLPAGETGNSFLGKARKRSGG
ncbi:MAG: phosphopentomutase [Syntrophothermus sp.]